MRTYILTFLFSFMMTSGYCSGFSVDHTSTDLSVIPDEWITKAKSDLHISYKHTSHGSQIISGLKAMQSYPDYRDQYAWSDTSQGDTSSLSLDDKAFQSPCPDLSQCDSDDGDGIASWAKVTSDFLSNPDNSHVNVIMWSWCNIDHHDIDRYLRSMEWLISLFGEGGSHARAIEHPVAFVFMTAHANGGGENDSSDFRNRQIREHCIDHDRILFDFADIENYDPDGNYYLNKNLDDALYYDGTTSRRNWASEYLARHEGMELDRLTTGVGVSGYEGIDSCAHSPEAGETSNARLNCSLKGRAAWHLFARLAGWKPKDNDDSSSTDDGASAAGSNSHVTVSPINFLLL